MHIIIGINKVVLCKTDKLEYLEDGLISVSEFERYAKSAYKEIIEVDSVPDDFADGKYKYTHENGFVLNETWMEPDAPVNPVELKKENEELKQRVDLMQKALDDLIFGGGL